MRKGRSRVEPSEAFDLNELLRKRGPERYDLHRAHLNHQLPRMLHAIGFDKVYTRGEGCYLYDADGNEYLDLLAGFGVFAPGRAHPAIKLALHEAIDADLPNLVQMDCALLPGLLAEALVARSHPGIERVVFTNSGAEAIEAAIKFARHATGRTRILYADHGFHGLTTGALSLNGGREFRDGFGPLLPSDQVPFGDIDALAAELKTGNVAAFVVEPIQGKGVNLATDAYWHAVEELCHRHKPLFVMDEVQAGLGRTGKFFCHQHYDIQPDIITISKALSRGYVPVGAMLSSAKVSDSVFSSMDPAFVHPSTFAQNQMAMVAGLATLQAFDDEDILDRVRRTGDSFVKKLAPLVERHEFLHEVRGKGLMIGLVFGEPTSRSLRVRWKAMEAIRSALFSQLMVVPLFHRHRILTQVAADNVNIVKLLPPLIAADEEVEYFVEALDGVLTTASQGSSLFFEFGRTMAKGALKR